MLIWICIVGSILIYSLVGYNVFRSRNQLRNFQSSSRSKDWDCVENVSFSSAHLKIPYPLLAEC
jgi:hypothetical protein